MVAEPAEEIDKGLKGKRRPRGGVRRLAASLTRLVDLQYRIWLTQAKLTMMRMAVYAALFTGAVLLGILAIIFLCIGLFRVLTDVVGIPVWGAFLIFGGGLALVALVLVTVGTKMLTKSDGDKTEDAG